MRALVLFLLFKLS